MTAYHGWRIAYARQAKADLHAREKLLAHSDVPECQELHFLQMACEKVCKAYLCGQGESPDTLRRSHAYIARILPIIARQKFAYEPGKGERVWAIRAFRTLARRIELLAPAVDNSGAHPANCEYPWAGPDGKVKTPAEHNFQMSLLRENAGRRFMKVLETAVEHLSMPKP